MLPSLVIAKAQTPDGNELSLVRRGEEWFIRVGGAVLMSSRQHASEEALAEIALSRVTQPKHVLVGGLGLGYTLRAVLERVNAHTKVTVSELLPELVQWNREHLTALNGAPLADKRTVVKTCDVFELLNSSKQSFDVVLLDVDNGPVALSDPGNQRLYDERGVYACFNALRPKGVLALWSAGPNPKYNNLLSHAGFRVTTERVAAVKGSRARHVLHIALRP